MNGQLKKPSIIYGRTSSVWSSRSAYENRGKGWGAQPIHLPCVYSIAWETHSIFICHMLSRYQLQCGVPSTVFLTLFTYSNTYDGGNLLQESPSIEAYVSLTTERIVIRGDYQNDAPDSGHAMAWVGIYILYSSWRSSKPQSSEIDTSHHGLDWCRHKRSGGMRNWDATQYSYSIMLLLANNATC